MTLFIGGPLDGKLIDVEPEREQVQVAIEKPIAEQTMPKIKSLTDIFYYKKEILNCPKAQYAVFVPRSYNCEDVIESLIEGYHLNASQ